MTQSSTESARTLRGVALLSTAIVLFAVMDTTSKYLAQYYPPNVVVWMRYLFHVVAVVGVLVPRQGFRFMRTSRPLLQIVRGLLLASTSMVFVFALKFMPIAEATALQFLSPLIVTVLAVVFLKEKVGNSHWVAVAFGFIGVLLIIRPGSAIFSWMALLPLAAALMFASYQVLTRRIAGHESPYTSIFYPGVVGFAMLSATLFHTWAAPQSLWHFFLLALAGIIGGLSHLIMIRAYEYAGAARLAPFSYAQVVWVTLGGYLVFGNLPDRLSFIGIAIIVAGGMFVATQQKRPVRKAQ